MFFAVIDESQKESLPEHETQLSSIRWHLSEGLYILLGYSVNWLRFYFDHCSWKVFDRFNVNKNIKDQVSSINKLKKKKE